MLHLFNKHLTVTSYENVAPLSQGGMQNMPFLSGADCDAKEIFASFDGILYQARID